MERRRPASGSSPVQRKAPTQTPMKSALTTSLKTSASTIATNGGRIDVHPGK